MPKPAIIQTCTGSLANSEELSSRTLETPNPIEPEASARGAHAAAHGNRAGASAAGQRRMSHEYSKQPRVQGLGFTP